MNKVSTIILTASSTMALANPNTSGAVTTEPLKEKNKASIAVIPLAGIAYERIASSTKDSEPSAGFGVSAKAKVSADELSGFVPFLQAGLNWANVGNQITYKPLPGVTQDINSDLNAVTIAADLGTQFNFAEEVVLDLTFGYATSVYGNLKVVDKTSSGEKTANKKLEKFSNLNLAVRGLGQIIPGFNVGVEATYKASGVLKVKDASETKFSGYAMGLVSSFQF